MGRRKDTFTCSGTGTLLTSAGEFNSRGAEFSAQGVQFPCHRGGDWGPETWKGVPRDTAGELKAAVRCLELPDPVPVIKVVLVTTCWNLAQQQ